MPSIDETVPERRMSRKMSRAMSRQMSHAAVAAEVRELQRRETDLDTRIAALRRQSTAFGAPPALSLQPSHERGVRRPGPFSPVSPSGRLEESFRSSIREEHDDDDAAASAAAEALRSRLVDAARDERPQAKRELRALLDEAAAAGAGILDGALNAPPGGGSTPLLASARAGNVAAVRLLREAALLAKEMGVDGVHNCGQDLGEDEWEEARAA